MPEDQDLGGVHRSRPECESDRRDPVGEQLQKHLNEGDHEFMMSHVVPQARPEATASIRSSESQREHHLANIAFEAVGAAGLGS